MMGLTRTLAGIPIKPTEEEVGLAGLGLLEEQEAKYYTSGQTSSLRLSSTTGDIRAAAFRLQGQKPSSQPSALRLSKVVGDLTPAVVRLSGLKLHSRPGAFRLSGHFSSAQGSSIHLIWTRNYLQPARFRCQGLKFSFLTSSIQVRPHAAPFGGGLFGAILFGQDRVRWQLESGLASGVRVFSYFTSLKASAVGIRRLTTVQGALRIQGQVHSSLPSALLLQVTRLEDIPSSLRISGVEESGVPSSLKIWVTRAQSIEAALRVMEFFSSSLSSTLRLSGEIASDLPSQTTLYTIRWEDLSAVARLTGSNLSGLSSDIRLRGEVGNQKSSWLLIWSCPEGYETNGIRAKLRVAIRRHDSLSSQATLAIPRDDTLAGTVRVSGECASAQPSIVRTILDTAKRSAFRISGAQGSSISSECIVLPRRGGDFGRLPFGLLGFGAVGYALARSIRARLRVKGYLLQGRPSLAKVGIARSFLVESHLRCASTAVSSISSRLRVRGERGLSLPSALREGAFEAVRKRSHVFLIGQAPELLSWPGEPMLEVGPEPVFSISVRVGSE